MDRLSNEYFKMKELAMNPGDLTIQRKGYSPVPWQIL